MVARHREQDTQPEPSLDNKAAKRLERLTESYWELRYEFAQLRARVNRLDPEQTPPRAAAEPPAAPAATAFVPLSSLKRGQL